jgi:hypothetical protein
VRLAVDHLAQIGLAALGGDHAEAAQALRMRVEAVPGAMGVRWMRPITWPDRVPGLVTWSGKQTLPRLICDAQAALRAARTPDLIEARAARKGVSGLDPSVCHSALDVGFSLAVQGIPVVQRPGVELLAIVGLETVPLVSFERRVCGYLYEGRIWRFSVERRGEHGYHQWGSVALDDGEALS